MLTSSYLSKACGWPVCPNDHSPPRSDAADVVGFSSMMERDEEGTLRLLKTTQRDDRPGGSREAVRPAALPYD